MLRLLKICAVIAMANTGPALAANPQADSYKKELIALNQNIGTYYFVKDHLSKDLTDENNIVVGSVQDFLINDQGAVQTLVGELNNMNLGMSHLNLAFNEETRDSLLTALQWQQQYADFSLK